MTQKPLKAGREKEKTMNQQTKKRKAKATIEASEYEKMGFTAIAKELDYERRNTIAVEFYRKVNEETWGDLYQDNCTFPAEGNPICVTITPIKKLSSKPYPTPGVLAKLAEAKKRKCFDCFEVMSLFDADPVLLGIVRLGSNFLGQAYVIARWGKDMPLSWLYKVAK